MKNETTPSAVPTLPGGEPLPSPPRAAEVPNPLSGMIDAAAGPASPTSISPVGATSEYVITFSEGNPATPEKLAIASKAVEDMSQEELRTIYHNIDLLPGKTLYSASTVNFLADKGRLPGAEDFNPSESMFIGDQIHKAAETQGVSLNKLHCYEELGTAPVPPALDELSKGEIDMLAIVAQGYSAERAVQKVRNNKITREVTLQMIEDFEKDGTTTPELEKLSKTIPAEMKNITEDMKIDYANYLSKVDFYEDRKDRFAKGAGEVIIDELPFRKSSAGRILHQIRESYESFCASESTVGMYEKGITGIADEVFTEYVVLWEHDFGDGVKVKCKSMFDRVVIDHGRKTVTINDIKSHSKKAKDFIRTNYFDYGYFRSMSFYRTAAKHMMNQLGHNAHEYSYFMVLLPISVPHQETGCHYPVSILSEIDMHSGEQGGWLKPASWSKFDEMGRVSIFLTPDQFTAAAQMGMISKGSWDLYQKGWLEIIHHHETVKGKLV